MEELLKAMEKQEKINNTLINILNTNRIIVNDQILIAMQMAYKLGYDSIDLNEMRKQVREAQSYAGLAGGF